MDMVEKVARAMAPMFADANSYWCNGTEWPNCPPDTCQCRTMAFEAARAAIAAMREPTEEMLEAGWQHSSARTAWQGMIDAALTSSEPQAPSSE
jgi:hypothetical protein